MANEKIEVQIPAGTQYGSTVSVDGHGMPRLGGGGQRGRLVVRVLVDIPTKLSGDARELLERYADVMGEEYGKKRTVGDRIRDAIDDILD